MDLPVFKAAMFDFDGTVTSDGAYEPSREIIEALIELTDKMPIAFCTGRQLESFERHGLRALIEKIDQKDISRFFRHFYLIAENGSVGYCFDPKTDNFEEFYKVAWPDELVERMRLMDEVNEAVKEYGEVYYEAHRVVIVVRTKLTYAPEEERDIKEVNFLSNKIYESIISLLKTKYPDYEKFLHVGNSGIGVLICPVIGDKNYGIKNFGEYLIKNLGIKFSDNNFSEILVVGDKHEIGGNDHFFLNGGFGTPFTVGKSKIDGDIPSPVIDENGERLFNDKGTFYLIKNILLK
jgi:hydroxymethylpyrimidine pyrophosphatase-like HAD family hydrolase